MFNFLGCQPNRRYPRIQQVKYPARIPFNEVIMSPDIHTVRRTMYDGDFDKMQTCNMPHFCAKYFYFFYIYFYEHRNVYTKYAIEELRLIFLSNPEDKR